MYLTFCNPEKLACGDKRLKWREGRERRGDLREKERKGSLYFFPFAFLPLSLPFSSQSAFCAFHFAFPFYIIYTRTKNERSRRNMQEQYLLECPLFHRIIHGKLILEDNCSQSRVEPNIAVAVQFLLCCASIDEQERKRKKTPPLLIRWSNLSTPVVTCSPTLFHPPLLTFNPLKVGYDLLLGYGCACLIGSL